MLCSAAWIHSALRTQDELVDALQSLLRQAPSEPSQELQESLAELARHEDDHVQYLANEAMCHLASPSTDSEETSSMSEDSDMALAVDPSGPTTLAAGLDTAQLPSPELAMDSLQFTTWDGPTLEQASPSSDPPASG